MITSFLIKLVIVLICSTSMIWRKILNDHFNPVRVDFSAVFPINSNEKPLKSLTMTRFSVIHGTKLDTVMLIRFFFIDK